MLGNIVIAGAFPMPPSSNMLYATSYNKEGKPIRVLTTEGRAYKFQLLYMLRTEASKVFVDKVAVAAIKKNYLAYRRNPRKVTTIKFHLDIMCVFDDERRDLTNTFKLVEDTTIHDFLGCNDRQVISMTPKRLVDRSVPEHIELVVYECTSDWHSGDVLAAAWSKIGYQGPAHPQQFYADPTDVITSLGKQYNETTEVDLRKWNYPAM